MSNRKLQKDIDIIFKKISEGLHEFNYHYDRYEAISTDEDLDNQREKEKLELDLKKEVKRLQKFREQIKIWQLKDDIKALALTLLLLALKLDQNKRLIEEAMEMYKEVERVLKLKLFSNQLILMAALMEDGDDAPEGPDGLDEWELDQDVEEVLLEPEDDEYPADTAAEIVYFNERIHQLAEGLQKLHLEHDKLANKKVRKNNLGTIEAKKEKIVATIDQHKTHIRRLLKLLRVLKLGRLLDTGLLSVLKDDLDKYIDSPGTFDNNVYDDIFNAVNAEDVDYSEYHDDDDDQPVPEPPAAAPSIAGNGHLRPAPQVLPPAAVLPPLLPAIAKLLRPAATPQKPMGNVKWLAAAAVGLPESRQATPEVDNGAAAPVLSSSDALVPLKPANDPQDPNFRFLLVISLLLLLAPEKNVFSDLNLVRLPPGIQDWVVLFTAKRNGLDECKILRPSTGCGRLLYNPYVVPMLKPYLPVEVQPRFDNAPRGFKLPPQFFKLEAYWNKIRAASQFDAFVADIDALAQQGDAAVAVVNELTTVLFFGYYHAMTPVENLAAELALFRLGWRPYRVQGLADALALDAVYFWFRRLKVALEDEHYEFGDYQGFDVLTWEVFYKYGFKFDLGLVQKEPSTVLC